jgi:DNA (cytosine-5)-methyltransferase 1
LNELALFAGAGGGILGGKLLGWRTVCAVEYDCYAASVLVQLQNDGVLQPFPIWDDVRTFDGKPWRGIVQVISGGFPCTDISVAGKGAGIDGEASGLWSEMARIVDEIRPCFVFVENSPALTVRGLGRVLGDLAALGYDARWGVLGAVHAGAPHKRERIWIVAHTTSAQNNEERGYNKFRRNTMGRDQQTALGKIRETDNYCASGRCMQVPDPVRSGREEQHSTCITARQGQYSGLSVEKRESTWWATEPNVGRVADGVASRVDRLKAIGNGQVPAVAAAAFRMLAKEIL